MLRDWLSSKKDALNLNSSSNSLNRATEIHDLEEALNAANLIFDDDLEGAEKGLAHGQSSFHKLGQGLVQFIRASLGFEADVMQKAAEILAEAESVAARDLRRAQKDPNGPQSQVYEAGAEFALANAMSQLMSAVIAVFRESIVDGMKGFIKLNSAYKTLQRIIDSEKAFIARKSAHRTVPHTPNVVSGFRANRSLPTSPTKLGFEDRSINEMVAAISIDDSDGEDEFFDADESDETHPNLKTCKSYGEDHKSRAVEEILLSLFIDAGKLEKDGIIQAPLTVVKSLAPVDSLETDDLDSPLDVYIHSGATLCYGMMLLMLSLVPPALSKLLGLVGYRGDRRQGLRMLWASSRYSNAMGAMAGLVLLAYHNGLLGSMDIVPLADPTAEIYSDDHLDGYPANQLEKLLQDMRKRFPDSKIWAIEQARMLAVQRRLDKSLAVLKGDFDTPLKQVQALAVFERSLQAMYSHDYMYCTNSFKECCERNNWSHALYMYTAGAAQVELYRIASAKGESTEAAGYAQEATKLIKEAKDKTGRRKAFGRQLPFDAFVIHKVNKWEARATSLNIPFVDAIGVSPIEEMIFLWNGFRKMPDEYLKDSLTRLSWSETSTTNNNNNNPYRSQEENDEKALLTLLRAVVLRSLRDYDEAVTLLKNKLLPIDRQELKGTNKEDWVLPAAHYETAVNLWMMCYRSEAPNATAIDGNPSKCNPAGTGEHAIENKKLMREAEEWLEKASKWEGYMLDARLGLRITSGLDTIRRWRSQWDQ